MGSVAVEERAKQLVEQEAKRLAKMKVEIAKAYPHALTETLVRDEATSKFKCKIKCTECGDENRWVFTSDLHQVRVCQGCSEKLKAAKKNLRKEQNKLAAKMIREGSIVIVDGKAVAASASASPKGWESVETSTETTVEAETPLVTTEAIVVAEKKKRGRPKGSKNAK